LAFQKCYNIPRLIIQGKGIQKMNNIEISSLESMLSSLGQTVVRFGFKLVAAIAIFVVGMWLANRMTLSLRKFMEHRNLEASLRSFTLSFINIILKVFVVVIVLTTVGVQMTSIIAVLGAASLAVGMALSGTMQNFAGGIVLLLFKPFRVGDTIEVATGDIGVVKRIMIFTTEVRTFDNQVVFLSNGALANGVITNLSQGAWRRIDIKVGVAYGTNIDDARREILDILRADARVKTDPAPTVFVNSLDDSAVTLIVRFWTKYEDVAPTTADVQERIYDILPKKKINFPFPQMDVHVVK